jgi:hypothetical protein
MSPHWLLVLHLSYLFSEIALIIVPPTIAIIAFNRGTFCMDSYVTCDSID